MTRTQNIPRLLGALIATCALLLACSFGFAATAQAETYDDNKYVVTYDADKQLNSDYNAEAVAAKLSSMQPGDSFTLDFTLKNQSGDSADWYMTSRAIETLEERSKASNGAYTYKLTYNGETIYSSDKVGGVNSDGFKEISGATGKWFFLGELDSGATGKVAIEMALDGETQGNAYMNTEGSLEVLFAVEDAATGETVGGTLSKTNDPLLLALYAIGIIAALACLAWCVVSFRQIREGRDA